MKKILKTIIRAIMIAIGLFMIVNGLILAVKANFTIGIILELFTGVIFGLWGLFFDKISLYTKKGAGRVVRWIVTLGLIAAFSICMFFGIYGSLDSVTFNEDVLIVLGCGVRGTVPTQPLEARLEKAVEYEKKNPNALIVVTGGQGPQEDITEAECMERYLKDKGVDGSKIVKEDKSTSTGENFRYTKKMLDERLGSYSAAIITNDFHIFRAKQLAKVNDIEVTTFHADTPWYNAVMMYMREILALGKFILLKD